MSCLEAYRQDGWAQDLGIEVIQADSNTIRMSLPFKTKNLQGEGGVVHGGVIGTLLHDAGALLSNQLFDTSTDTPMHTVDFQINYLRATKDNTLTCQANILRQARHYAFVESLAVDEQERVIAQARMVFGVQQSGTQSKNISTHLYQSLVNSPIGEEQHSFLEMLNSNLSQRRPGFSILGAHGGTCQVEVENQPVNKNYSDNLAVGAQIFAADSAGVFSSFTCGEPLTKAATIDLKLSPCTPIKNENLIAIANSLYMHNKTIHHQLVLFGKESKDLAAIGSMTLSI
ncbi:MAG TPA: hypothetical protein DCZ03_00470 [Gammaproteobacteria bacterium]|nr:hypothetical protein [Gammaproteobacteria bacterium]